MTPDHDTHPIDDLAVYAVDALDPVERAAVEAHLAGCAACRHELDLHRATLGAMAVPEQPPAGVWAGISRRLQPPTDDVAEPRSGARGLAGDEVRSPELGVPRFDDEDEVPEPRWGARGLAGDEVRSPELGAPRFDDEVPEPEPGGPELVDDDPLRPGLETREVVVVPLPPPAPDVAAQDGVASRRPRHRARGGRPAEAWWRSGRVLAAAAAVVVALGVGAALVLPGDEPEPSVGELAADAAADPDSTLVTLSSATGEPSARVVLADDADFDADFVVFDDLPALGADRTYQLWRTDQGTPVSLGVLGDGADGAASVSLPDDVAGFAISREPAGGSPNPTDVIAT